MSSHGPYDSQDLIELYAAANGIEADRIVLLLQDDGIEALARATTSSSFPAGSGSQHLILVREADAKKAADIVRNARDAGAISTDGEALR